MPANETVVDQLNALLEAERAGVKSALAFRRDHGTEPAGPLIETVYQDESWCCAMLIGQIKQLGGVPSERTGEFLEKVLAKDGLNARLSFLNRGQGWVVRKLEEMLSDLPSGDLRTDLQEMLDRHRTNIDSCAAFLDTSP